MKAIKKIHFQDIESIPQLIKDFLDRQIAGFSAHTFSLEHFENQIALKNDFFTAEQRSILAEALKLQLEDLTLAEVQQNNLEKITDNTTFTVTTGHQLNLFTGPAYFIYKIIQTIKTALYLKENFPDYHFVPVFWMATEDHDFEEISHFKTAENFYEIHEPSGGAVGRIKVHHPSFIHDFETEFKDSVFGTELILLMKEAYKPGNTLSQATKILVQRLFGSYGLLMIDGDDHLLKKEMQEIFKDEILNQSLKKSSEKTIEFLTERYGKVQVNPREINLFYLTDTRNRIDRTGENYEIIDKNLKFSEAEILNDLNRFPEKFSPNALMRPVYQETILPNLAYIGGNAEIMYWLELKDYFASLKLPFPILVPRSSFLFLKEKTLKKAEKMDLKTEEFFSGFAQISREKLMKDHEILKILEEKENVLIQHFAELRSAAELTDQSFGNLVKAEEARQLKSFGRMKKRLLRAEKIKNREFLERLEKLFLEIHPGKNWQERVFNFSVFYSEYGEAWLKTCLDEMEVTRPELIIIAG
ncbi:bacillithiol biosynthesis cysteine-adding enzyme BshC [Chryseobacterium sp.]|uniref:bacillithiol biosynthesis cysteine-adding enzyme BshC n=1 Tax=Chryseobacterium sp. TaxID=1871047 RepID=UPI0011C886C8|nr:bacillithiol biosynthesis cysteine-adding enzyme BshC [Chryseobacterium sp.]TXF76232.1 bacillithiol biosynthesis cysteine-adding enzyme BshC [Chryseobacterium sp.]